MALALPPPIWTPSPPTIIRPADASLLHRTAACDAAVFFAPPFFLPRRPTLTLQATYTSGLTSNTATLSAIPIGAASADRLVIVAIGMNTGDSGRPSLPTVTLGGSVATIHSSLRSAGSGAATAYAIVASQLIVSGTTTTLSVALGAQIGGYAIAVWTVTGLSSMTAIDSESTSGNPGSVTINTSPRGFVILATGARSTSSGTSNTVISGAATVASIFSTDSGRGGAAVGNLSPSNSVSAAISATYTLGSTSPAAALASASFF